MRDRGSRGQRGPGPRPPASGRVTGAEHSPTRHRLRRPAGARLGPISPGRPGGGGLGGRPAGWQPCCQPVGRGGASPDPVRKLPPRGRHPRQDNPRCSGPTATRGPGREADSSTAADRRCPLIAAIPRVLSDQQPAGPSGRSPNPLPATVMCPRTSVTASSWFISPSPSARIRFRLPATRPRRRMRVARRSPGGRPRVGMALGGRTFGP
jgi:hypothetical protein